MGKLSEKESKKREKKFRPCMLIRAENDVYNCAIRFIHKLCDDNSQGDVINRAAS